MASPPRKQKSSPPSGDQSASLPPPIEIRVRPPPASEVKAGQRPSGDSRSARWGVGPLATSSALWGSPGRWRQMLTSPPVSHRSQMTHSRATLGYDPERGDECGD